MNRQPGLPEIAMRFFDGFRRFDNALKRAGYLRNVDVAEANWDAFARSLDSSFFEEVRNAPEAATLVNAPPKKRFHTNGSLEWRDGQPVTNEARDQDDWKPEFLEARQKRLVGLLSEHWQLDPGADEEKLASSAA